MKRTILFVVACFFLVVGRAQMIPTQAGVFLYFDPVLVKKNKVNHLFLTQHEKYKQRNKVKIAHASNKAEILFDTNGRALSTVYFWKGGSDTVRLNERFALPKNGVVVREELSANMNKIFWLERGNEQQKIAFDAGGNEILNEMTIRPVESIAYVQRFENTYDSLDRLKTRSFTHLDIQWNADKKGWDTIPKKTTIDRYVYEKGSLARIDTHPDPSTKDPDDSLVFFYSPEGVLIRAESSRDLTVENPVKMLLLFSPKQVPHSR